jgi:hypothetical protein
MRRKPSQSRKESKSYSPQSAREILFDWALFHGEWLYHATSLELAETILQIGLSSPDHPLGGRISSWEGGNYLEPQFGCVYLGNREYADQYFAGAMLKVRVRGLEVSYVRADEDHLSPKICSKFKLPQPPTFHGYDYYHSRRLGEWAAELDLHSPGLIQHSLRQGSIAYQGWINPNLIQRDY